MCSLSYYDATNYLKDDGSLIRRIVDYDSINMGVTVNTPSTCCEAGIQLNDLNLLRACLDTGVASKEFEITDENECLERDLLTRIYLDGDGNPIPGYSPVTEITNVELLSADDCCMQACEAAEFYFLLPGCPMRTVAPGTIAYTIDDSQ